MSTPYSVREALEKAGGKPLTPITPPAPRAPIGEPERRSFQTIDDMRGKLGEPPYSQAALDGYRKATEQEGTAIAPTEAEGFWGQFWNAMGQTMTGKMFGFAKKAYFGVTDPFTATARPATMFLEGFTPAGIRRNIEAGDWGRLALGMASKETEDKISEYTPDMWDAHRQGYDIGSFLRGDTDSLNMQLQRLNDSAEPAYWGEKFLAEQINPTTLVGWQVGALKGTMGARTLLGRTPYAGKIIEPFDVAYIQATKGIMDLVAKPIGFGLDKIPKTSIIKASNFYNKMISVGVSFFGEELVSESAATTARKLDDLARLTPDQRAAITDPRAIPIYEIMRGFDPTTVADIHMTSAQGGPAGFKSIFRNLPIGQGLGNRGGRQMAKDMDLIWHINDNLAHFSRDLVSRAETVDNLIRTLGGSATDKKMVSAVERFIARKEAAREEFVEGLRSLPPKQAVDKLAHTGAERLLLQERYGIAKANQIQGFISAWMDQIDPLYRVLWRNGIQRYILSPGNNLMLNFPAYGAGNVMETVLDSVGNGVMTGTVSNADMLHYTGHRTPFEAELLMGGGKSAQDLTTTAARRKGAGDVVGSLKEKDVKESLRAAWYEVTRGSIDAASRWTSPIRNSAGVQFFMQEVAVRLDPNSAFRAVLKKAPPMSNLESFLNKVTSEATKGTEANWDNIIATHKSAHVSLKDLEKVAYQFDLPPAAREALITRIRDIPNVSFRADLVMEEMSAAAKLEYLNKAQGIGDFIDDLQTEVAAKDIADLEIFTNVHHGYQVMGDTVHGYTKALGDATYEQILWAQSHMDKPQLAVFMKKTWGEYFDTLESLHQKWATTWNLGSAKMRENMHRVGRDPEAMAAYMEGRDQWFDTLTETWHRDEAFIANAIAKKASAGEIRVGRRRIWESQSGVRLKQTQANMDSLRKEALGDGDTTTLAMEEKLQKLLVPDGLDNEWANIANQLNHTMNGIKDVLNQKFVPTTVTERTFNSRVGRIQKRVVEAFNPPGATASDEDLLAFIDEVKTAVAADGPDALRAIGDEAWEAATVRYKDAFAGIDNGNWLAYYSRALFPFGVYETMVWSKMARLGLQHPAFVNNFMPGGGAYWENTNEGYIPIGRTGVQFKPTRFFGYNRINKAFQHAEIPSSREGTQKTLENWVNNGERGGYYPGLPWQMLMDLRAGEGDWTEALPPWIAHSMHVGVYSKLAVTRDEMTAKWYSALPGNYQDYKIRSHVFSSGGDPSNPTEEQMINSARAVAGFQAIESLLSALSFKPQHFEEQRALVQSMDSILSGIPLEQVKEMQKNGVSVWEVVPQSPPVREFIQRNAPNYYLKGRVSVALLGVEEKKKRTQVHDMMDEIDMLRDNRATELAVASQRLHNGEITGDAWRNEREQSYTYFAARLDGIQKQAKEEGLPLTRQDRAEARLKQGLRLFAVSEVDEALHATDSLDPRSDMFMNSVTGETNWTSYHKAQEAVMSSFSPEAQSAATWWKYTRKTPEERNFEIGHQKWGYFDVGRALDWAAESGMDRNELEEMHNRAMAEDTEMDLLIQGGMSLRQSKKYRASSSIRFIDRIVRGYRQNLRRTGGADFERWLATYYGTPSLNGFVGGRLDLSDELGERPAGMPGLLTDEQVDALSARGRFAEPASPRYSQ